MFYICNIFIAVLDGSHRDVMARVFLCKGCLFRLCVSVPGKAPDTDSTLSSDPVPLPFSISSRFFKKYFSTTGGNGYILIDTQDVEAAFLLLSDQDLSQGNIMKST